MVRSAAAAAAAVAAEMAAALPLPTFKQGRLTKSDPQQTALQEQQQLLQPWERGEWCGQQQLV
jgi:hypothetical protein